MRILICEDNVIIAMELEMTIEDMGYVSAGNVSRSDDCLARCKDDGPDMVLVDVDLGDGPTGPALTKQLADLGIPSIIVSGQARSLDAEDHAADAVLTKPLIEAELREALTSHEAR